VKASDKYRFSLQWGAGTAEKVQAGDFLESLGNRKSEFVVLAVNEYLSLHPESLLGRKLQIIVKPHFTLEQIREMIMPMIEEKLSGFTPDSKDNSNRGSEAIVTETDIDTMLRNLDLFEH
jgi:hypothetical protein